MTAYTISIYMNGEFLHNVTFAHDRHQAYTHNLAVRYIKSFGFRAGVLDYVIN